MQWMLDGWRATVWFAHGYRQYTRDGFLAKQQLPTHIDSSQSLSEIISYLYSCLVFLNNFLFSIYFVLVCFVIRVCD